MTDGTKVGRIDFGTLSSGLRVIRTTPAWEVVRDALERLRTPRAKPFFDPAHAQDVTEVQSFASVLRQDAPLIAQALLCGAMIGQACPAGGPGERLLTGLSAISSALRFRDKSEPEVAGDLSNLAAEISARFNISLLAPFANTVSDLEHYKRILSDGLAAARSFEFAGRIRNECRDKAWKDAAGRVSSFMGAGPPGMFLPPPTLDEILTAVAGVSPGTLVPFDLSSATIVHWSGVFVRALTEYAPGEPDFAPPWLAAASLRALGFGFSSSSELAGWLAGPHVTGRRPPSVVSFDPTQLGPWVNQLPAERGVIIVLEPEGTLIAAWRPSSRTAALALTAEQLGVFFTQEVFRRPPFPALPMFHVLAIEEGFDRHAHPSSPWSQLVEAKYLTPEGQLADPARFGVAPGAPEVLRFLSGRPRVPLPGKLVVGPQSIEDLFPIDVGPQFLR